VRSDNGLTENLRDSDSWKLDPLSGKTGTEVARYRMSVKERVPMSLSGKERNHLFLSESAASFKDVSNVSGADSIMDGRSFAILDFDRDGWQDAVLANANAPVLQLFRNRVGEFSEGKNLEGKFVALRFVGGNTTDKPSDSFSNRDGVGARFTLEFGNRKYASEFSCGEGLAAQNSGTKLVGLGNESNVRSISVSWPSGRVQIVENVNAGEMLTFFENESEVKNESGVKREAYVLKKTRVEAANVNRKYKGMNYRRGDNAAAKLCLYVSMATWCPSCRKHLPELKQLRDRFEGSQIRMTGVPVDDTDDAEKLKKYVAENNPPYEMSFEWTVPQRFEFVKIAKSETRKEVLPTTVITNNEGEVLEIMAGIPSVSDIVRLMD